MSNWELFARKTIQGIDFMYYSSSKIRSNAARTSRRFEKYMARDLKKLGARVLDLSGLKDGVPDLMAVYYPGGDEDCGRIEFMECKCYTSIPTVQQAITKWVNRQQSQLKNFSRMLDEGWVIDVAFRLSDNKIHQISLRHIKEEAYETRSKSKKVS